MTASAMRISSDVSVSLLDRPVGVQVGLHTTLPAYTSTQAESEPMGLIAPMADSTSDDPALRQQAALAPAPLSRLSRRRSEAITQPQHRTESFPLDALRPLALARTRPPSGPHPRRIPRPLTPRQPVPSPPSSSSPPPQSPAPAAKSLLVETSLATRLACPLHLAARSLPTARSAPHGPRPPRRTHRRPPPAGAGEGARLVRRRRPVADPPYRC